MKKIHSNLLLIQSVPVISALEIIFTVNCSSHYSKTFIVENSLVKKRTEIANNFFGSFFSSISLSFSSLQRYFRSHWNETTTLRRRNAHMCLAAQESRGGSFHPEFPSYPMLCSRTAAFCRGVIAWPPLPQLFPKPSIQGFVLQKKYLY